MPATIIRVDTSDATYLVATAPAPKLRDPATGEVATNHDSGEKLYTVTLVEAHHGRAQVLKVTLPASGLPPDLPIGAPVQPRRLTATPWARQFTPGRLTEGVLYRATALDPAPAPASPAAPRATGTGKPTGAAK